MTSPGVRERTFASITVSRTVARNPSASAIAIPGMAAAAKIPGATCDLPPHPRLYYLRVSDALPKRVP